MRRTFQPDYRRAVILMVVLAMLALFAIVGLAFVLFAQNNNTRSNNFSLAWMRGFQGSGSTGGVGGNVGGVAGNVGGNAGGTPFNPVSSETVFKYAIAQLIYDVPDDASGTQSAIRGHSLARTMYGYNDSALNTQPFNGSGRYHYTQPGLNLDDYDLVNYTYFPGIPLRDPERVGTRNDNLDMAQRGAFTGGANPPHTYPNLDNLFLAASTADGKLISPSFHRQWHWGASLQDQTNPRWTDLRGRLSSLRPRPADNLQQYTDGRVGFPYPSDAGGDVKNKIGYNLTPGNDSIWIDLGYPIQIAGDGRRYKPLFAFLVEDLDNRVNLNTAGNLMGKASDSLPGHASHQGWGKWEVNLAKILNNPNAPLEWRNLLASFPPNDPAPTVKKRYGVDKQPAVAGSASSGSKKTRLFAQADWNAFNEITGSPTSPLTLPGALPALFPAFSNGFGNGSTAEHTNHASLYDFFRPDGPPLAQWDDYVFGRGPNASDMKKLLVNRTIDATSSEIAQLCPANFDTLPEGLRRRNLVTLLSMQLGRTGMAPWLYRRSGSDYTMSSADGPPSGTGAGVALPDPTTATPRRDTDAALEAVNLDRNLRKYPHQDASLTLTNGYHGRFDYDPATNAAIVNAFNNAHSDRQTMASDIFLRLLILTGVPSPANPRSPSENELKPIRWMAQLAANIVDYIDEDEICTSFNFYPTAHKLYEPNPTTPLTPEEAAEFVGKVAHTTPANGGLGGEKVPSYWVFGTELPTVVLNEVFSHYELPLDPDTKMPKDGKYPLKIWAELYTPFPAASVPAGTQAQDNGAWPLRIDALGTGKAAYSTYKVVLANSTTAADGYLLARQDNALGAPAEVRAATSFENVASVSNVGGTPNIATAVNPDTSKGSGYFLVGPPNTEDGTRGKVVTAPRVPADVPFHPTNTMTYQIDYLKDAGTHTPNDRYDATAKTGGVTVLLRRLANTHLPEQADPALPNYNPYITVDYMEQVPTTDVTVLPAQTESPNAIAKGKKQPYASDPTTQVFDQQIGTDANKHTLGKINEPSANRIWLTHLDRQLISPYELLTVSGYRPHQLTHQFMKEDKFQHLVNWFDDNLAAGQSHRLFRLFGMLETPDRAAGISLRGRIPGRVNINTIWDFETFAALCDRNASNTFTDADVVNAWQALISSRSPGTVLDPMAPPDAPRVASASLMATDRPFFDMAAPIVPVGGAGDVIPAGRGLEDTIMRRKNPDPNAANKERLFQTTPPATHSHPYMQSELLNKIANSITTRSNVFAVWLTVGFFEVVDDPATGRTNILGEEIDRRNGTEVRYRFFSIVDRTQLVVAPYLTGSFPPPGGATYYPTGTSTWVRLLPQDPPDADGNVLGGLNGSFAYKSNPTVQIQWSIKVGTPLVIDRGTSAEETVVVEEIDPATPRIRITLRREHSSMRFTMHGNPGPQPNWDPLDGNEQYVVPYWEILP